jgi:hypothetical protein
VRRPRDARFRLRSPRIESSPKRVHLSGWNDHAGIAKNPALRLEPDEIIESIERGEGLPEKYYRAGIDQDPDELLQQRGIMHLHLGGKDSSTLVFLIQYANAVVLLESNSHVHFRTTPKGKNIVALVQAWFLNLERDMADAARAAQAAANETEGQKAKADQVRLAAALARLKREAGKR